MKSLCIKRYWKCLIYIECVWLFADSVDLITWEYQVYLELYNKHTFIKSTYQCHPKCIGYFCNNPTRVLIIDGTFSLALMEQLFLISNNPNSQLFRFRMTHEFKLASPEKAFAGRKA